MSTSLEVLQRFEAEPSRRMSLTSNERHVLDRELDETMNSIASCDTFRAAEPLLRKLEDIHRALATFAFKHHIELPARQREIVREYDRCDVPEVRRNAFQKIKIGEFPWCADSEGRRPPEISA